MKIVSKFRTASMVFKEKGLQGIIEILLSKYRLLYTKRPKSIWQAGIKDEIEFWDAYFSDIEMQWAESCGIRLNPDYPLQSRPAALLQTGIEFNILDVGAGPLTYLGKKIEGKQLKITAVDPLANEYASLLDKYNIKPLVRTERIAAEELTHFVKPSTFDLVFARNCIDHSYQPEKAVLQMISVVKSGCYVLLEHRQNEAENEHYQGLHQWNFSLSADGDFIVSSKSNSVNLTKKYAMLCNITCEIVNEPGDGEWLITRIHKK